MVSGSLKERRCNHRDTETQRRWRMRRDLFWVEGGRFILERWRRAVMRGRGLGCCMGMGIIAAGICIFSGGWRSAESRVMRLIFAGMGGRMGQ